jgi:hypothetical protein
MAWEILFGVGALLLLAALVYGMIAYKTRNKANDRITEAATREEYRHPNRYAAGGRESLKQQLK